MLGLTLKLVKVTDFEIRNDSSTKWLCVIWQIITVKIFEKYISISDVNETLNNTKMVIWDDVLFFCKRVGAFVVKNLF